MHMSTQRNRKLITGVSIPLIYFMLHRKLHTLYMYHYTEELVKESNFEF